MAMLQNIYSILKNFEDDASSVTKIYCCQTAASVLTTMKACGHKALLQI